MKQEASGWQRQLWLQRCVAHINFVWFAPLFLLLLYVVGGYRCHELRQVRRRVREHLAEAGDRPLLICANHLTMIDSMLITAYAFPTSSLLWRFRRFPWNVPELANFGRRFLLRIMCYLGKCVYVEREGSIASKKRSWEKVKHLLRSRELVCIFPEGGRSRTGRIDRRNAVYGVGHLMQDIPDLQVLCVYLRGEQQNSFSFFPRRGERFNLMTELIEPKTELKGRRGSRDLTMQVVGTLENLESQVLGSSLAVSD